MWWVGWAAGSWWVMSWLCDWKGARCSFAATPTSCLVQPPPQPDQRPHPTPHLGSSTLEHAKGAHHRLRHALSGAANLEVLDGPLRLRAPQPAGEEQRGDGQGARSAVGERQQWRRPCASTLQGSTAWQLVRRHHMPPMQLAEGRGCGHGCVHPAGAAAAHLSSGTSRGPKVSYSVRVPMVLTRAAGQGERKQAAMGAEAGKGRQAFSRCPHSMPGREQLLPEAAASNPQHPFCRAAMSYGAMALKRQCCSMPAPPRQRSRRRCRRPAPASQP